MGLLVRSPPGVERSLWLVWEFLVHFGGLGWGWLILGFMEAMAVVTGGVALEGGRSG